MSRGIEFLFRLCGAVLGALTLGSLAAVVQNAFGLTSAFFEIVAGAGLLGVIIGWIIAPRPIKQAQLALLSLSGDQLGAVLIGGFFAMGAGALFAVPLSYLPAPFGQVLPFFVALALAYLGVVTLRERPHDFAEWVKAFRPNQVVSETAMAAALEQSEAALPQLLLDTSVIIDGRITDISKTGFINATLTVPNFVLTELQHIADSPDPIRRKRGRRGLEVLNVLRNDCPIPFEISDMDVSEVREVDSKLVALARHMNVAIMTNDYNLNRVAGLQGVTVLNINDLANAVKAAYLPGEELRVKVIQEGREAGQGVGYLDDGTMVVVENGRNVLNQAMEVVVTKVLQTSAGRMIFAKIP